MALGFASKGYDGILKAKTDALRIVTGPGILCSVQPPGFGPWLLCVFPRNVARTAQYATVPIKISCPFALVSKVMRVEKPIIDNRTVADIQALVSGTQRRTNMGMARIATPMSTFSNFAKVAMPLLE